MRRISMDDLSGSFAISSGYWGTVKTASLGYPTQSADMKYISGRQNSFGDFDKFERNNHNLDMLALPHPSPVPNQLRRLTIVAGE